MIVEFIGSTGAGKTTLLSEVQCKLAGTTKVTTPFDMIATPLGLRGVTHPTARNLIQEFIGLPFFINSLSQHKTFVAHTLRLLARQDPFSFHSLNYLRSLERKIGVYEFNKRYEHDQIILVDEGTVLTAHIVFVYTSPGYSTEEMAKFASLIPLPDAIVYVRAPMECLVKRSLQRNDPPREMRSKNRSLVEQYIKNAVTMFEQLVQAECIQDRVLIVDNPESANHKCDKAVDNITEFILNNWYFPNNQISKFKANIC